MATDPKIRFPSKSIRERFGITSRTLARWKNDPDLGFPEPITINGRDYYEEHAVEAWERQLAAAARKTRQRAA